MFAMELLDLLEGLNLFLGIPRGAHLVISWVFVLESHSFQLLLRYLVVLADCHPRFFQVFR